MKHWLLFVEKFIYKLNLLLFMPRLPRFNIIASSVILIAALVLVFDKLFTPQPIQIMLQSGQEITTSTAEYFSLAEALLLVISAFIIGAAATYLFYNSERSLPAKQQKSDSESEKRYDASKYDVVLPLLRKEEKQVIIALKESNGEILQNKLVAKLGLSKVKITRLLYSLGHKGLVAKERRGITNMVKLK